MIVGHIWMFRGHNKFGDVICQEKLVKDRAWDRVIRPSDNVKFPHGKLEGQVRGRRISRRDKLISASPERKYHIPPGIRNVSVPGVLLGISIICHILVRLHRVIDTQ